MPTMPSISLRARVALDKHGFRNTHSLGQNFLLDERLLSSLLDSANVWARENVLEIGPGAGVMTALMAERGANVLAVELDEKLRPVLADVLAPWENAQVVFADFLKTDTESLIREKFGEAPYIVVANLPYYITADIIEKLISLKRPPERIEIMVQKEAADRLLSSPGQKQWCALAADVRFFGETRVLEEVPPDCFDPAPHVMSAFIEILRWDENPYRPKDPALMRKLIRAAFAMRRKTLANNLKVSFSLDQQKAQQVLESAGADLKVRGEALTLEEMTRVCDALYDVLNA